MILTITKRNAKYYPDLIREMHRMRCRVFHDRLGWEVDIEDGEERDEYDQLDPVYLLALDDQQELVGSWRLLPTTGPYMLKDTFPQLLDGQPAPVHPKVWECSRFSVETPKGCGDSLAAINAITGELFHGMVEFCMAEGVNEIVTVYDLRVARILPRVGCRPRRTTSIQRVGITKALAGWFPINQDVLADISMATGISEPVLVHALPAEIDRAA
jgi:acyl homoserine lactone synthase